jgi:predicted esterase
MHEQHIDYSFKARYYKLGTIDATTRQVWFVLHGYGQLARYFVTKFKALEQEGICVIAPEGLSRFYLEDMQPAGRKNNRVGATWMTQENRLMDIGNYLEYLNTLYHRELQNTNVPVTVLGFSQGAATASRWVAGGTIPFTRLVLWAGVFPPDMDFDISAKLLQHKQVYLVYGKNDPFLTDTRFAEMHTISQKLNTPVQEITFEGEHELDEKTLLQLVNK